MNKCPNCGYEVPEEAKFCMQCGCVVSEIITADNIDLDTIAKLYELETQLQDYSQQTINLIRQEYPEPEPEFDAAVIPTLLKYPDAPKTSYPIGLIILIVICICIPIYGWAVGLLLLLFYFIPNKQKQRETKQSQEIDIEQYKNMCRELDEENARRVAHCKEKYNMMYQNFLTDEYEPWKLAYNEWLQQRQNKLEQLSNISSSCSFQLHQLYDSCRLIPQSHQTYDAICNIYNTMKSTNYSVREAIELYDRQKQRDLTLQYINAQQETARQLSYQNSALDSQNELLYAQAQLQADANEIAEQARHDANKAELVAMVQRHNTNKYLKEINKKL